MHVLEYLNMSAYDRLSSTMSSVVEGLAVVSLGLVIIWIVSSQHRLRVELFGYPRTRIRGEGINPL